MNLSLQLLKFACQKLAKDKMEAQSSAFNCRLMTKFQQVQDQFDEENELLDQQVEQELAEIKARLRDNDAIPPEN